MTPSKPIALLLATGTVAGTAILGVASAAPAGAATSARSINCSDCEGLQFTGNGVRIHTKPSSTSTTLGLAYKKDTGRVHCSGKYVQNGYVHAADLSTGVDGWVSVSYASFGCD